MCGRLEHPIDWHRQVVTEIDRYVVNHFADASLVFLRSMDDVRERYEAEEDVQRYREIATPIILAALDAFGDETSAVSQASDEALEWLAERNADWGAATNALYATVHVKMLDVLSDNPNSCRYRLSAEALEIVQAAIDEEEDEGDDLDHSRPLDVHTWSDHPEVNAFVDHIYAHHFKTGNADIQKKHLKVVLLDLYMAWKQDPTLKISYSRNVNSYKPKSRYNALHISNMTVSVVDRLTVAGLVTQVKGFYDRREGGRSRESRMWPTEALIQLFQEARFGPLDIGGHENRECIVLRNEAKNDISYAETPETERMRAVLQDYNSLLRQTFIDIPTLERPFIELEPDHRSRVHKLQINQRDKFVRRIFNRGAWDKGGRFWGGWWQRCPKVWRPRIFMDDKATSELDYSGLHIVMLYAQQGINYWTDVGEDPYQFETPAFLKTEEQTRSVAKQLLLTALNAKDARSAFGAFRQDAETGSREKRMRNEQLAYILDMLRERHKPIADRMASDAGIDLMNLDAKITERLIEDFTHDGIPILTIHDSYIVPNGLEEALERNMQKAFEEVMGIPGIKVKDEAFHPERWEPMSFEDAAIVDPKAWAKSMRWRYDPPRSERYKYHLESFRRHLGSGKE